LREKGRVNIRNEEGSGGRGRSEEEKEMIRKMGEELRRRGRTEEEREGIIRKKEGNGGKGRSEEEEEGLRRRVRIEEEGEELMKKGKV
jgi:hypothetical protein